MDPDANASRIRLKRPRVGSLDNEADRPPPLEALGSTRTQMTSPVALDLITADSQRRTSEEVIPEMGYGADVTNRDHVLFPPILYEQAAPNAMHTSSAVINRDHVSFPPILYEQASPNAMYTSAAVSQLAICMPGTRAFTLQRLTSLVTSTGNDDPDVIWMRGPAGSGKSAIMRTMAHSLYAEGVLLGSFFFFRHDSTRNTSASFIPTIVLQLRSSLPATCPPIERAIDSSPTISSQPIRHQLQHLLELPLELAASDEPNWKKTPLVLVIDGLDECTNVYEQVEIIEAMRQLASTIRSSTNRRIKILFASRPERAIKDEFECTLRSTTIIKLDPSDANIDLYYDTQLDKIRRDNGLPESWPSREQIKWLKKKTSGQYSFAHISMGFLADGDPVERFKMLETGVGTHGLEPFAALDAQYATIFRQIPPEMAENALLLVRFWILKPEFANALYNDVLECILSLPHGFPSRLLPYLSSIFDVDYFYRPLYASLSDFLGDASRSRKYMLFLDSLTVSTSVVEGMLKLCIPPKSPIDKTNAESLFQSYDKRAQLLFEFRPFLHFYPFPTLDAILDQLHSLLPTMDLYAFGYCNCLLSILFENGRFLASNPSQFDTIETLLNQICSIQRFRFATYEAIEAGGDSGFGFFGLLLVFLSHRCTELGTSQCRVDEIVGHLLYVQEDNPDATQNAGPEEPLSLHTLAHQLSTAKGLKHTHSHRWEPLQEPISLFALVSTPVKDNLPQLPLCLSRTIEMFLDLPSQNTRIQGHISKFLSCPDHTAIRPACDRCMSNLEQVQTSVVSAVVDFVQTGDGASCDSRWLFDAQIFARCYSFVASDDQFRNNARLGFNMMEIGDALLREIEREDPKSVGSPLYTMVSNLHRWAGSYDEDDSDSEGCGLYDRFRRPELGHESGTHSDVETKPDTTTDLKD